MYFTDSPLTSQNDDGILKIFRNLIKVGLSYDSMHIFYN